MHIAPAETESEHYQNNEAEQINIARDLWAVTERKPIKVAQN